MRDLPKWIGVSVYFVVSIFVFDPNLNAKTFTMDTPLPIGLLELSDPVEFYQPFLDDLKLITGLDVILGAQNSNTFNDVASGALKFGTGLTIQSGIPAMELYWGMPFGMEPQEFISWLYEGGGVELARDIYANEGVVPIPFRVTVAEGGGWFRNRPTEGYLHSGNVRMRMLGFGGEVLARAFPAVTLPPLSPGVSALSDFGTGQFTDLEFAFPTLDLQQFFDIPRQQGEKTIVDFGARHYIIGSWWQPYTYSEIWINKEFYDNTLSQDDRDKIDVISRAHVLRALAQTSEGQGAAVKFFQDEGVIIWGSWPKNVLKKLRDATVELINERSAVDEEWSAVISSMKDFVRNEQTIWAEATGDRRDRFEGAGWSDWESIFEIDAKGRRGTKRVSLRK